MASGSQKFIARNRAPRVQIEYDVELYGAEKKVQLPFVMGVMSDLAGKSARPQPSIEERKFLEIDVDSFDERMRAIAPRVSFAVPNTLTGEGSLAVDLTFESMADFSPGAIAARIEPLRALLDARTQLSNLLTYMDGKAGAEALIERVLGDRTLLAALVAAPAAEDAADDDALAALRAAAPEAVAEDTSADDALAALRAAAPEAAEEDTSADDALAALRAAAPEAVAEDTSADDALAALRATAPEAVAEDTSADDALAALRAAAPEAVAEETSADDALAALRAAAPEASEVDTSTDDALAALLDAAPEAAEEDTSTADALAALLDAAPEAAEEDTSADDALAALRAAAPEAVAEDTSADDALAALRAAAPEAVAENTSADDALAALRAAAPEAVAEDTSADDALAALRAAAPEAIAEHTSADDALAALLDATPEAVAEDASTDDALAALLDAAPEAAEEDTSADDTLAALLDAAPEAVEEDNTLDALLSGDGENVGSDLDALLGGGDETSDLDALLSGDGDDTGSDLDALLSGGSEDAGSDLDALLSVDGEDAGSDLDALLSGGSEDAGSDLDALLSGGSEDAASDLDALLGGGDETSDLDTLLSGDSENVGSDLDALLGGGDETSDLDALLSGDSENVGSDLDALLGGGDETSDLDALLSGGSEDTGSDLDALLSGDDEDAGSDLDALLADAGGDAGADLDALLGGGDDTSAFDALLSGDADLSGGADPGEADAARMDTEDDMSGTSGGDEAGAHDGPGERRVDHPFGFISAPRPAPEDLRRTGFRMAIFGDFTGRAARGLIEPGEGLAHRRAIPLDVDTVEEVIEGFATELVLPVGPDGAGIRVALKDIDSLHPDEIFDTVEIFSGISGLRQRLKSAAHAPAALAQLQKWGEAHGQRLAPPRRTSAGSSVPANLKLGAFQQLIGDTGGRLTQASPIDDMVARIIGPHVIEAPNPDAGAMLKAVDDALSSAMRLILHHPEFQSVEALWRSLDFLARRIETDVKLTIDLFDVSAEELAVDLAAADDLSDSGFLRLLTDRPLGEEGPGGYSALFGLYTFEETPPHAELLARIAQVAAHVDAPFFTAISPAFLDVAKEDRHPLVAKAWDTLRGLPEAGYLGVATPRFLLRRPYGERTDPVDAFDFEEFTESEGLSGMLWANPVLLVAVLLGIGWSKHGKQMSLGSVMSINDIPFHYVRDRHGDQVALPHTERNLTTSKMQHVVTRGYQPVLSIRGRDEIRLGSFQSLAGSEIRGRWTGVPMPPKEPPPTMARAAATPADIEMDIPAPADAPTDDLDALLSGLDAGGGGGGGESGDADLDALLSGLDAGGEGSGDADLDALLAGFDDLGSSSAEPGEMDPELAALLEGL
jgi:type VI secretion system ImpB/VipA family protein